MEGRKDGRTDGPAPILPATARGPKSDSYELRQQHKHLRNMEISGASTIESISERTINWKKCNIIAYTLPTTEWFDDSRWKINQDSLKKNSLTATLESFKNS